MHIPKDEAINVMKVHLLSREYFKDGDKIRSTDGKGPDLTLHYEPTNKHGDIMVGCLRISFNRHGESVKSQDFYMMEAIYNKVMLNACANDIYRGNEIEKQKTFALDLIHGFE